MLSSFFSGETENHYGSEHRYYVVYAFMLVISGLLLLALPIFKQQAVGAFLASWLLFITFIMAAIRPIAFRRGIADLTMGLTAALFYGLTGWVTGGTTINDIEGYRYIISIILLAYGISRMLVFSRLITVTIMPMLIVCCIADISVAILFMLGYPAGNGYMIYWFAGMLLLLDAAEQFTEAIKLRTIVTENAKIVDD